MKHFTFLLSAFVSSSLMAIPGTGVQDMGTANIEFSSQGTVSATLGAFQKGFFKSDIGLSYDIEKAKAPLFALKCGVEEGAISPHVPAFSAGLFQMKSLGSNYNVYHIGVSKSLETITNGVVSFGYFQGERGIGEDRKGICMGYKQVFLTAKDAHGVMFNQLAVEASYTQKNTFLGGSKLTLKYKINPSVQVNFGPSWSSSKKDGSYKMGSKKWVASISMDI